MASPQALAQPQAYTQEQVADAIKTAIPHIEKRIGTTGFKSMCKTLAVFINRHEALTPDFLSNSLRANETAIEAFYGNRKREFPSADKVTLYTSILAAVIFGNVYNIDPLRILALVPKENQPYDALATHRNADKSTDVGLYQVNNISNALTTYKKDPRYELIRFNRTIERLGGSKLKGFPCSAVASADVFENTLGATLKLVENMGYLSTTKKWQDIYAAYNGSVKLASTQRYAQDVIAIYDRFIYEGSLFTMILKRDTAGSVIPRKTASF